MEKDIGRINIDREENWLRVKENVMAASREAMAKRLAGNEALRKEVEQRMKKIMEDAFTITNPNLLVNGHNYEDYLEVTEPFDEALDNRMWAQMGEVAEWEHKIVSRRTKTPGEINKVEVYCARVEAEMEWLPEDTEEEEKATEIEAAPPPRHEETVQTLKQTLENLKEIRRTAPVHVNRAERAKVVKEQISSLQT